MTTNETVSREKAPDMFDMWCASFNAAIAAQDGVALGGLFAEDGYWRDMLTLDERIQTAHGPAAIKGHVCAAGQLDNLVAHCYDRRGADGHCSIPADNPKKAAETLGRIFGGEVTRFPPGGPDAWMAWSKDGSLQLECTPRGNVLIPDSKQVVLGVREGTPTPNSEVHIGICVETPEKEIIAIAKEAGWPAYPSVRIPGDAGFSVLELWVEGKFLLELTDPVQTARLERSVTVEGWKAAFSL